MVYHLTNAVFDGHPGYENLRNAVAKPATLAVLFIVEYLGSLTIGCAKDVRV